MIPFLRQSRFVDFNTGEVFLTPEEFIAQATMPLDPDGKIDFFECRVDVYQLSPAAAMLKMMDDAGEKTAWGQADHALMLVTTSYFEMIGKVVNPGSRKRNTSGVDFDEGFADVFPNFVREHGRMGIEDFRQLMRNGLYHLGYPKKNLLVHNSPTEPWEVDRVTVIDPREDGLYGGVISLINPRRVAYSIVAHFGWFLDRLRANEDWRRKFEQFNDEFFEVD